MSGEDYLDPHNLRGADSNSLLRLYDRASERLNRSQSEQEKARAGRAVERIAKELRRRNVQP
jgi:hypothetical protein